MMNEWASSVISTHVEVRMPSFGLKAWEKDVMTQDIVMKRRIPGRTTCTS